MAEKTELYFEEIAPMGFFERIFTKEKKATVSTTMFVDYTGDQYPIRNITSVQIRYKPSKAIATTCKWIGFIFLALGLLFLMVEPANPEGVYVIYVFLLAAVILIQIWNNAKVYIVIGAGGSTQDTYPHRIRLKGADEHVKRLSTAINNAISDLQNK